MKFHQIPGHPAYSVDGNGYFYCSWRMHTGQPWKIDPRVRARLQTNRDDEGRLLCRLYRGPNEYEILQGDRLACRTFHKRPPTLEWTVRHLNGDMGDNRPDNLEWARPAVSEEEPKYAPLTAGIVRDVRRRLAEGATGKECAERFGISQPTVSHIRTRKIWADLED